MVVKLELLVYDAVQATTDGNTTTERVSKSDIKTSHLHIKLYIKLT
jgi:hypothetical protein